jgi:hypothetical protein
MNLTSDRQPTSRGWKVKVFAKNTTSLQTVCSIEKRWRFFAKHAMQMSEASADLDFTNEGITLP